MIRELLNGAALAALFVSSPVPAQLPGTPAATAAAQDSTPPMPRVDGLRLREGRLTYRATVHLADSTERPAGVRTITIAPTLYAGGTAWSIAERVDGGPSATSDSGVLVRDDLTPLHWDGVRGAARIAAEIARDTVYAGVTWPAGRRSIVAALGGPVLTSSAALETVVSLLPLQPGFRATARLLTMDLGGARVIPVTIAVEGMESVQVDAGRFDCWVVGVYGDHVEDRLWVRRDSPVVVRNVQQLPSLPGATVDLTLSSDERR